MGYCLPLADSAATRETVGGKGAALARLAASGLPVPDGFHVTTAAYLDFVASGDLQPAILDALAQVDHNQPATADMASEAIRAHFAHVAVPAAIRRDVEQHYTQLPGRTPAVAVRSSATAEDLPDASFAGQLESFLNVRGIAALSDAVRSCWASLWTARAIAYRARHGIDHATVRMAVIVQQLVPADVAGVMFTANPLTGARGELVISAAWGLGEAIVAGEVTPDHIVVDRNSGKILVQQTASKETMRAPLEDGVARRPVAADRRDVPALGNEAVSDLADLGVRIETLFGRPMDIEWAEADGQLSILQARPITALPDEPGVEAAWTLPDGVYVAMRNNIVELMTEPLSPLFETLGRAAINGSLRRQMVDFLGRSDLMPAEMIITVNHYAYYNGSLSAGQITRILLGSVGIARRMFSGAVERWLVSARPRYAERVARMKATPWHDSSATRLIATARQLTASAVDAYGALVSGVIPAAWISEALFTLVNRLLGPRPTAPARTYLMGYDSVPIQAEKSLYDLAKLAREDDALTEHIIEASAGLLMSQLFDGPGPADVAEDVWRAWRRGFRQHLDRYGHLIYDLDFAHPVPADDPTPLLRAIRMYVSGKGTDPHARQETAAAQRDAAVAAARDRLAGLRRRLFERALVRAQRFAPLREDGLADIGLAYPLLRQVLHRLGRRLTDAGAIAGPEDVYWLTEAELVDAASALDGGARPAALARRVAERKPRLRAAERLSPPRTLLRVLGREVDVPDGRTTRAVGAASLTGVAASPGRVTGPARVLHGPRDFDAMRPGDILVASITTPAWTPLFAMAAGIVTDIGGPLSHGSIVAREYGIPAVLGTATATRRIRSGTEITVDGDAGLVYLEGEAPSP